MNAFLAFPLRLAWPTSPGAFRLVLAMLVFVYHFSSLGLGHYAMDVFFLLSGYWLYRMWTERYSATVHPYFTFMVSRVWRLAPVMLVVSAITIPALLWMGKPAEEVFAGHPVHLAASSVVLLGYAWLPYAPVGSAWSLDVEMQFYLVAPVIVLMLARGWKTAVLVGALALSLVVTTLAGRAPIMPQYALFFAIGMVSAHCSWRPTGRLAFASGAIVVVVVALVLLSPWRDLLLGGREPGPLYRWNVPLNEVLAVVTAPLALYTVSRPSDPVDRMLGELSYIVYLLHWVAMQWFFTLEGSFAQRLPAALACFVIVPLASSLIWRWVDRPANRARSAWVRGREVSLARPRDKLVA